MSKMNGGNPTLNILLSFLKALGLRPISLTIGNTV